VMKSAAVKDGKAAETRVVDMEALNALQSSGRFHAEITCMRGQQVSVSSGRSRTVIYDQEAVVAQNAVAMNPRVRQVNVGAMLEVTPTILHQSDIAYVEVRSKVAQWSDTTPVMQANSATTTRPGDRAMTGVADSAVIDRLNLGSQELRTTVQIPVNQSILVGGMTLEPAADQPKGAQLYLILRVSTGG
jgi:type II secretory pathway component GspD/PulD (secretin)